MAAAVSYAAVGDVAVQLGVLLIGLGAAAVLVCFWRFLRVLYRDGRLHQEDLIAARRAQLLPVLVLATVLAVEVILIDRFRALTEWIPLLIGVTALLGALWAVERARAAVLRKRREFGDPD